MTREYTVTLPTFHRGQSDIYAARGQRNVVRCGRRFGKTKMLVTLATSAATKGEKVGIFAPESKQLREPYAEALSILQPIKRSANASIGALRTITDGVIDLWYTNDNVLAGRGREYDLILGDEMAFTKNGQMLEVWDRSINPTMLTRPNARVWLFSTPNGLDPENFFWQACHPTKESPFEGFVEHYAPSTSNPLVTPAAMEKERLRNHPLVFDQEYRALFVDFSGVAFFGSNKLLIDGAGVAWPTHCDQVFAVIDSAVKGGKEHDGTAVTYWAQSNAAIGHPLVMLDWDIVQIDGALLEHWIPSVFVRLNELALACGARFGSGGAYIEDAASGSILLQQCALRELPATALPQQLTGAGKDARAINASGPVHRGEVKFSGFAHDKVVEFKGTTRNHMAAQVFGFRIGDKKAATRADDLLDSFVYAVAISLGNTEGIA